MSRGLEGLLLVDKPSGPTSHDIVARARRLTGQRRVGHAGTLDPPASGLLPLLLGRATRLLRFLPASPKVYAGAFRLGRATRTDDLEGETLRVHEGALPGAPDVVAQAVALQGRSLQVPPRVSARKIGGRRMYALERAGVEFDAPATEIEVGRFDVRPTAREDTYRFEVEVSGGTYVRALVRDLGERLGCGAALAELRRTRIGPLSVVDAVGLGPDAVTLAAAVIPPAEMPFEASPLRLTDDDTARRLVHGQTVPAPVGTPPGTLAVYAPSGALIGMAATGPDGVRPLVILLDP